MLNYWTAITTYEETVAVTRRCRQHPVHLALRVAALASLAAMVVGVGQAAADPPGLPRTYRPEIIDTPNPLDSASFGWGLNAGDITGDGKLDLLVSQSNPPSTGGQIYMFNGVTRQLIQVLDPPEKNPTGGGAETFSYVYNETMPDIGSCPGGDGPDADKICDASTIGPGDGIPEILAGSRAFRLNATNNAAPAAPGTADPAIGRGYVFDGATRVVLKRIDMPLADRISNGANGQNGAQFGRLMMVPSGLPPCAGLRSENNNFGVGDCPDRPLAERIGDVDGGGKPDIVISARSYNQPKATAFPTSLCASGTPAVCNGAGKAWVYGGESIAGSNPQTILDTPIQELPNPRALPNGGSGNEYGGNKFRLGDITGDGLPEWVIPDRNADFPLNNPDPIGGEDVGASFTWSGKQTLTAAPNDACNKTGTATVFPPIPPATTGVTNPAYSCMLRTNPMP